MKKVASVLSCVLWCAVSLLWVNIPASAQVLHCTVPNEGDLLHPLDDTDCDGTPDVHDVCLLLPGPVSIFHPEERGCPVHHSCTFTHNGDVLADADCDGFDDNFDQCPTLAGPFVFDNPNGFGCPLHLNCTVTTGLHPGPDTDCDGFSDVTDVCSSVPGVAGGYPGDGCPIVDGAP
ncbi:hypothetical protein [Anthocerotibacter panamensis]|uniref:hypothetical protein n=1 Tax=Anthocerotibacter panamensis TaxID=2857077 RepID=UPI001C405B00|nr:hypothetical protein [Anthocerotibacter panamensis]